LLTVARIHPRKGQLAVLEALARLPEERRSRIVYRMAGPLNRPSYLRKLKALARARGIDMSYLGCLDDEALIREYSEADVFVMTSDELPRDVEGFGLGCLEASAFGLPVIAHRTGGVEDAVREGTSGILVDAGDRGALASTIAELVDDRALRRRLGEGGRDWAARFSWDATAATLFDGLA
jgi:glycosyltransferase involved in cell wall biosynthesis